ncbi:hypothetical protein [Dokdonia sp. 4H-3-7-5]|uniref:hypothetical protein n=1 Tax=Dokdonia sp. (strain 4H-3-7-5) TaxID=983548 RepID=UPI00020A7C5B|nr:hypothetical protein [Dokdonia sp. 4H-3-7-5]AEE19915.1 hypothetical protein Krodi_1932 [Dokdonia sp. 4H-3-7-5]
MKLVPRWLPELTLRTLRVVVIGLMLLNVWSVYTAHAAVRSELVPKYLAQYSAFPHYIFIAFYSLIIFYIWRILKGALASENWWVPVIAVITFESTKFFIYGFLMWVNPFG